MVALITTFGSIMVALIATVRKEARKAVANTEKVSNGFTQHVLDEFKAAERRDEELAQKFDDHLAWSREETLRLWAAVVRSTE